MAQLKDLIVTGASRFLGNIYGTLKGNADTATTLATARTIQTNLASTSSASFNGSANVTPGVTGILPVANGGTGNSSVDTAPTSGSTKMVTSGGVYTAVNSIKSLVGDTAVSTQITNGTKAFIKGLSVSGRTITYTKGDGTTGTITTQDTNTTYSNMKGATSSAAGTAGLVPAPAAGKQTSFLRGDGTWVVPTNTTYSNMTGATTSAAGASGLVPAPAKGAATRYLRSDGTWQVPPDTNTTYSAATTSAAGLMSAADKTKLNGIATGATKVIVDSALSSTSTNPVQNKIVNTAISNLNSLVGDIAVATQISNAMTSQGISTYTHSRSGTVHNFAGSGVNGKAKITADFVDGDTFTVNGTAVTAYWGNDAPDSDLIANGRWVTFIVDGATINFKGGGGVGSTKLAATTATAAQVLSGKTFYSGNKTLKTGIIASKAAESKTINASTSAQSYTFATNGKYCTGDMTVTVPALASKAAESKTLNPGDSYTFATNGKYCTGNMTVTANSLYSQGPGGEVLVGIGSIYGYNNWYMGNLQDIVTWAPGYSKDYLPYGTYRFRVAIHGAVQDGEVYPDMWLGGVYFGMGYGNCWSGNYGQITGSGAVVIKVGDSVSYRGAYGKTVIITRIS